MRCWSATWAVIWSVRLTSLCIPAPRRKDEEGNLLVTQYIDENSYYADFNVDKLPIDAIDGKNDTLIAKVTAQSENGADNSKLLYRWFKYDEAGASWQAYKNSNEAVDGNIVEITDTGKYMCVAIENSGIRRVTKESQILYVLEPEQPQVKIADEGKNYISVILSDPANGAELEVKPLNESGFYHTDYDKNNKTISSFSWRKSNSLIDKEYQDEITDDVGASIYYAKEEGYYYGYALTERNLKTKISENATTYRVTKPLTKPTSANCTIKGITDPIGGAGYIGESIILEFMTYDTDGNIDNVYANDTIYYQWYYDGSYGGEYIPLEQEGASSSTNNGIIKFTPTERGEYRIKLLVVRNNQNYPEKGILEDKDTWYTLEKQLSNGGYDELTITIRNDN